MLFVHEVHEVVGRSEGDFEAAYRDGWIPRLAETDDARLLWFLHRAHGTGSSYTVITVTAVRNGAAWEALAKRLGPGGDLHEWAAELEGMRHAVTAKMLVPVAWSPLQELDLGNVPVDGSTHEQTLFMEDTAWPHRGMLDAYLEKAGSLYLETLRKADEAGRGLLRLEAAFVPAFGTGEQREVVLWQRVVRPEGLLPLFGHDVPEQFRGPGTWMHDALEVRDRWESRLLRTAPWSPLA